MKATANGWTKEKIQDLILTNKLACERALIRIYERQTADEQNCETTTEANSRGFTAFDAEFLTSCAKNCLKCGGLTERQHVIVQKKITKYWKQLMEIAADHPKQIN